MNKRVAAAVLALCAAGVLCGGVYENLAAPAYDGLAGLFTSPAGRLEAFINGTRMTVERRRAAAAPEDVMERLGCGYEDRGMENADYPGLGELARSLLDEKAAQGPVYYMLYAGKDRFALAAAASAGGGTSYITAESGAGIAGQNRGYAGPVRVHQAMEKSLSIELRPGGRRSGYAVFYRSALGLPEAEAFYDDSLSKAGWRIMKKQKEQGSRLYFAARRGIECVVALYDGDEGVWMVVMGR